MGHTSPWTLGCCRGHASGQPRQLGPGCYCADQRAGHLFDDARTHPRPDSHWADHGKRADGSDRCTNARARGGPGPAQSRGIPLQSIFFQYIRLWQRLTTHFKWEYIVRCLLQGDAIEPVCKLQVCRGTGAGGRPRPDGAIGASADGS